MSMTITFNELEIKLLLDLLKAREHELPLEIHHTDRFAFRQNLRDQEKRVEEIAAKFESALAANGGSA